MLSATELLGAVLFIAGLTVMSIIDVAFANVNKVSMRRLVDGPRGKAASSIAALLDTRTEVLTSIHIIIQMLVVSGAVSLFTTLEQRAIRYTISVVAAVVVLRFVSVIWRLVFMGSVTRRLPTLVGVI